MNISAYLTDWTIEPALAVLLVLAAVCYWRGVNSARRAGQARRHELWRSACFGAGLLAIFLALDGPIAAAAHVWLTAGMVQQELLVMIAAPLLLFGAPLGPFWRALPLNTRQAVLSWVIRRRWPRRLLAAARRPLSGSVQVFVLFCIGVAIWTIPSVHEATLTNSTLLAVELASLLLVGLLFWAQVIESQPIRPRLGLMGRVFFVGIAGLYSSVLGSVFMFSTAAFYTHYIALKRPVGAPSALVDQHIAGAAIDIPGVLIFFVAISALLWLWMREDERQPDVLPTVPGSPPGLARREVS
jgi:putative membrane protein